MKAKQKLKMKERGITLIALVITIIVLLILASITIGAISGDNGILSNAGKAKVDTEISQEKEIIQTAAVQAIGDNIRGNLEQEEFQNQLNKIVGTNTTVEVADLGEEFEVLFVENGRYYTVDKNANISDAKEIIKDNSPADIATGKDGEELEEGRYEIWSIEDLVVLSNISRGKGNYMKDGEIVEATRDRFSGDTIYLMRTLNFNSSSSYSDLSITWSYDSEEDAYILDESSNKNLRELITDEEGVGFIPISENTGSGYLLFTGTFDGQNNEIQNLCENGSNGGLFSNVRNVTIKNLGLTNININNTGSAGGIANRVNGGKLYNCYITGSIIGKQSGGLANSIDGNSQVVNCYNAADIQSRSENGGGLTAYNDVSSNLTIVNSYNSGNVATPVSWRSVSGIVGWVYNTGKRNIINTLSMGNLSSGMKVNTFYSVKGGATVELENAYYLDTIVTDNTTINENSIEFSKNSQEVLNTLNQYVKEHKNDYEVELYSWKFDSEGLPTFEK